MALPTLEEHRDFVIFARGIVAEGGDIDASRLAKSEAALRDAGEDPSALVAASRTRTATLSRPASAAAAAEAEDVLLGIDSAGKPMSLNALLAAGVNPVDYLRAPGVSLTATGKDVLARLSTLPMERAKALGVDVPAVTAYARKAGIDPAACLRAEIERIDQLERDKHIMADLGIGGAACAPAQSSPTGSATEKPRDPLIERDREIAARFGLQL